jgi:hypothetical protein
LRKKRKQREELTENIEGEARPRGWKRLGKKNGKSVTKTPRKADF